MTEKTTLVVYTCFTGDKEQLGDPLERLSVAETDLTLHFVCLSDKTDLQSSRWQVIPFDTLGLPADKASRLPKARPHAFFSSISRYSLYVDNTVQFRRLPTSQDLKTTSPYLFKLFQHNGRKTILEEAAAIATLGYDTASNLIEQLEHYARFGPLEGITPLSTCTVMLRDHSSPIVQRHGEFWWAQILAFTRRDQMSFDFSRIQTNCQVEYWPGNKHENNLVYPQENFSHRRVLANFDEKRYLWHHRDNPEVLANPKKHYLASNPTQADAIRFSRRDTDPLNLFCHLFGSSLGSSVSPRRRVSESLHSFIINTLDPRINFALGIQVCLTDSAIEPNHEDFLASCKAFQAGFNIPKVQTVVFKDQELAEVRHSLSKAVDVGQCGLVFIDALGVDMLLPALPILLEDAGASLGSVAVVVIARGQVSLQSLSKLGLPLSTCLKKDLVKTQIQEVYSDFKPEDWEQTLVSLAFNLPA
jgi:hypothetical protein